MKVLTFSLLSILLLLTAGCGSSLKKKCEAANWYNRGYKSAYEGTLPAGDFYYKKCAAEGARIDEHMLDVGFKKAREEVCLPEKAEAEGRNGKVYNFPVCMNFNEEQMMKAHRNGLKEFCNPSKAYDFGASGKPYENVCKSGDGFNSGYIAGRKKYLNSNIANLKQKLVNIEAKLEPLQKRQTELKTQLSTKRMFKDEQMHLLNELNTLSFDIDNLITEKNQTNEELEKFTSDINKL